MLLLAGCSDDPVDPKIETFTISGRVTDVNGSPVADSVILLDLAFEYSAKAYTWVSFDLLEPDHVRIDLLNWCRDEVFTTREMDLPAGKHSISIESIDADEKHLTDQSMWILFSTSAGVEERPIVLLRNVEGEAGDYFQWDYAYVVDHVRVQAVTGSDGRYIVDDPCLGFGEKFATLNEDREIAEGLLAWRVRAWAYHEGYTEGVPSEWTSLNPATGGSANIVMQ